MTTRLHRPRRVVRRTAPPPCSVDLPNLARPRGAFRQEHAMTPIAMPASIVDALRHPAPREQDFSPTKFCPASTKAWFAVHYLRFASCDFPRHQFTLRFYRQLMHCHGHIAHYSISGFWTEFFTSTTGKIEFLEQTLAHPCYGAPDVTWSDVEREIIARLKPRRAARPLPAAPRHRAEMPPSAPSWRGCWPNTARTSRPSIPESCAPCWCPPTGHRLPRRRAAGGTATAGSSRSAWVSWPGCSCDQGTPSPLSPQAQLPHCRVARRAAHATTLA